MWRSVDSRGDGMAMRKCGHACASKVVEANLLWSRLRGGFMRVIASFHAGQLALDSTSPLPACMPAGVNPGL